MTEHERGSVLVAVVGLAGLVAVVATVTLQLARQTDMVARGHVALIRAVSAAAGGAEVANMILSDPGTASAQRVVGSLEVAGGTMVRFDSVAAAPTARVTTVTAEHDGRVHVIEVQTTVLATP